MERRARDGAFTPLPTGRAPDASDGIGCDPAAPAPDRLQLLCRAELEGRLARCVAAGSADTDRTGSADLVGLGQPRLHASCAGGGESARLRRPRAAVRAE